MSMLADEYLTIADAAATLGVHASTIRRWIADGSLPSFRVGRRRVALKRQDLEGMITPHGPPALPRLSPERQEQFRQAVAASRIRHAEQLASRGGHPFSSSDEIVREMREERLRDLDP